MFTSWLSVSWAATAYYRASRVFHADPNIKERSLKGAIGFMCWKLFEIGPRAIAIAMFASQTGYGIFIVLVPHWIGMIIWLVVYQKVKPFQSIGENFFFVIAVGFVRIFAFLDVGEKGSHSRFRAIFFYFLFYTENFFFALWWVVFPLELPHWMLMFGYVTVPIGFFLCTLFHLSYYVICHPSNDIKWCV